MEMPVRRRSGVVPVEAGVRSGGFPVTPFGRGGLCSEEIVISPQLGPSGAEIGGRRRAAGAGDTRGTRGTRTGQRRRRRFHEAVVHLRATNSRRRYRFCSEIAPTRS